MTGQGVQQPVFRYQYMVTEIGTIVLRQLFDRIVGTDLVGYFNDSRRISVIQSLKQRLFTDAQRKLLPPYDPDPSSSNFHFVLLSTLLRNVCDLRHPGDPVWMNPLPTDLSIEAFITRLRLRRNELVHGSVFLPEGELERKIKEVAVILHNLSDQFGNRHFIQLIIEAQYLPLEELQPVDKGVVRHVPPIAIKGFIVAPQLVPAISTRDLLRLSSITLYAIKMEHIDLSDLVKYLSSNVLVESINLSYVSCNSHGKRDSDCTLNLDLEHQAYLTSLRLYNVNIECGPVNKTRLKSITLCPVSENIINSYSNVFTSIMNSRIEEFHLYGSLTKFNGENMTAMASTLESLKYLKSLKLNNLELPNPFKLYPQHDTIGDRAEECDNE